METTHGGAGSSGLLHVCRYVGVQTHMCGGLRLMSSLTVHLPIETGSLDDSELSKEVTLDIELQGSFSLHFPDVRVSGFRSVLASGFNS